MSTDRPYITVQREGYTGYFRLDGDELVETTTTVGVLPDWDNASVCDPVRGTDPELQQVLHTALECLERPEQDDREAAFAERLTDAVEAAQDAFWTVIARRFPEITTGDLDPMATFRFEEATTRVVKDWIYCNRPSNESESNNG